MKLSKWNSYISLGEKSGLIYNAFSDLFIAIKEESDDFRNAINGKLEEFTPTFRTQMIEAGALVDEGKDEVAEVAELIEKVDNDDSRFQIIVNPTLDCNFHCWYCYENHLKDSCMTPATCDAIVNYAQRHITTTPGLKYFHLSFFGGEPLLRFDEVVRPLVNRLGEICKESEVVMSVHFTSNAFLLTDEMIAFLKPYGASFQITLDGGRENHNNTRFGRGKMPSFDVILDNVKRLAEAGLHVTLRINYTTKVIDSTEEIVSIISEWPEEVKRRVDVDYQRVWQDKQDNLEDDTYRKVKGLRRKLNETGFATPNNRLMDYVRHSCYADKRHELLVNFNGDVFSCTARDFKPESRLGHLTEDGLINWEGERFAQRMAAKFTKTVCHECRIAPICGGGCRTKCVEHSWHDGCNLGYTPEAIDELIIERFEERWINKK